MCFNWELTREVMMRPMTRDETPIKKQKQQQQTRQFYKYSYGKSHKREQNTQK